jgi:1,4-alpha-glucan branching enzyme
VDGGATFRAWGPNAKEIYLVLNDTGNDQPAHWSKNVADLLVKDARGYWGGFFPGVQENTLYRFWVVGEGSEGFKRDPYARELEMGKDWKWTNCVVRDPRGYKWRSDGFRPPGFSDLIIYQLHIGAFFAKDDAGNDIRPNRVSKILDVADRIEYLADLGVNAILTLPFQEFSNEYGLGYSGVDLFSPEMDYSVSAADLPRYMTRVNRLFSAKGQPPVTVQELTGQVNQFKVFIDLCHLYGIAVIADVVFNHAGGDFGDQGINFFDRQSYASDNNSLYFTDKGWAGGKVFAYWQESVRQFLIDNAKMHYEEFRVDGLRFDEVTVIDRFGGWSFCQDLTNTLRYVKPSAVQIAEYWGNREDRWKGVAAPPQGLGFDVGYGDGLKYAIRGAIGAAAGGADAAVIFDAVRDALYSTSRDGARWTVLQHIENHDLVWVTNTNRVPRIPALAHPGNTRSWYARSRAKVATGLLLTAPGVPMIFMGQEFLEDKFWSDDPKRADLRIWWEGLEGKDKHMSDQHRFTRELMWLRRKQPALCGDGLNVFHVHNENRVIAFHRWIPGVGGDVVVVASLNERTFYNHSYRLGFPGRGHWREVFNSDIYDDFFNPNAQGNPGGITADGPPWNELPTSAMVTLPANSLLVFARDDGDF